MSTDTALIKLYSGRMLALAADIPHAARLEAPDATAKQRSPLCGSVVTVDVRVEGDVLTGLGQDVKACALGQAAAAVVGANAPGATLSQLATAREQLFNMLKGSDLRPEAPFSDFEVLLPAVGFENRHASILLSIDGVIAAMRTAMSLPEVREL
mgnify:CR=1 FL=1